MLRIQVVEDGLPLEEEHPLSDELKRASISIFQNAIQLLLADLLHKSKLPSSFSAPDLPPLCGIICDTVASGMQDFADAVGLPRIDFWTSTAAVYSMCTHLSTLVSNGTLPLPKSCWLDEQKWTVDSQLIEGVPGLPPFPPTDIPAEFVQAEEVSNWRLQFILAVFARVREAHSILVHSVHELESQVFDALRANGFPVYAVGPLLESTEFSSDGDRHECMHWLDKQPPSSVIYIAMGSIVKLNSSEMHALALGLEASGHRFLWVIRQDSVSEGNLLEALPEGFLQRAVDKGLGLIISWSPQAEVLGHLAVGAFFSHCGWNSTLESIWHGVPMVACPRRSEQRSNARWIVEKWKIGVELERQLDGSFTKEAVQSALQRVLELEGKGGVTNCKQRVRHAQKVAQSAMQKGGHSRANLVDFLQRLRDSNLKPRLSKT